MCLHQSVSDYMEAPFTPVNRDRFDMKLFIAPICLCVCLSLSLCFDVENDYHFTQLLYLLCCVWIGDSGTGGKEVG